MAGLFYYKDIAPAIHQTAFDHVMNATREQFESDPAKFGMAYYLQPFDGGQWIFE